MPFLLWLPKLLDALVSIPKIGDMVSAAISSIVEWWVSQQTAETMAKVSDAAAMAARAQTREDRHAALDKWRDALSRPRVVAQ